MTEQDKELAAYTHSWPKAIRIILLEKEQDALASLNDYKEELAEIWAESKKDHPLLRRFQRDAKERRQRAIAAAKAKAKESKPGKLRAKWSSLASALAVYDAFATGVMKFDEEVEKYRRRKDPISIVEIELRNKLTLQKWYEEVV